jgi:predicted GTPase
MGAGGRDFHDFATVYRDDPGVEVVAFTAAQIPGIDERTFPASLAGPRYPDGIPVRPEDEVVELIADLDVDEVAIAYSDLSHPEVMHRVSMVMAAGADVRLLGPDSTMLEASVPVLAVCAVRTGVGKSQTSRAVCALLTDAGLRPVLVRHPMPYGDLEAMRVQRFATLADIDAAAPTIEEREEYEAPVAAGIVVYAGVDYEAILAAAEAEADVIVWDGGNNDFPFLRPDVMITLVDPMRPGHEVGFHPGEVNLRLADIVVVAKVDAAPARSVDMVERSVVEVNPSAVLVRAASPVTLGPGPPLAEARVLVVEDGPTVTHGGMPFGAGTVAARAAGARHFVDPRAFAVGSIAETFRRYPHLGVVLPAMGYSPEQLAELIATIRLADCDVVVTATPVDLTHLGALGHPARHAEYRLADAGRPTLAEALAPAIARWAEAVRPPA